MQKSTFLSLLLVSFFFISQTFSQTVIFTENFDSYTSGNKVACSAPTLWTTWSNAACGSEDPVVSNTFSHSTANAAKVLQNNDLVKDFGTAYTTGHYKMSFWAYIPAAKTGYFNTLATFAGSTSKWGMECYFDAAGAGRLFGGSATAVAFTWPVATWFPVEVEVNLDTDNAIVRINSVQVHTWQWTLGASGTAVPKTLDANNFFGAAATDEFYFDDYQLIDMFVVPVELTSFNAASVNGTVELNWSTATEANNRGFEVERRTEGSEYIPVAFVNGKGTTSEKQDYVYVDNKVETGHYYYRLKQVDFDGRFEYSGEVEVDVEAPLTFALAQNYPNPFNPSTKINFSIPEAANVRLAVYNLLGQEVALLVNGMMEAGNYDVNFDASSLSTGAYFYKLENGQSTIVKKMLLSK